MLKSLPQFWSSRHEQRAHNPSPHSFSPVHNDFAFGSNHLVARSGTVAPSPLPTTAPAVTSLAGRSVTPSESIFALPITVAFSLGPLLQETTSQTSVYTLPAATSVDVVTTTQLLTLVSPSSSVYTSISQASAATITSQHISSVLASFTLALSSSTSTSTSSSTSTASSSSTRQSYGLSSTHVSSATPSTLPSSSTRTSSIPTVTSVSDSSTTLRPSSPSTTFHPLDSEVSTATSSSATAHSTAAVLPGASSPSTTSGLDQAALIGAVVGAVAALIILFLILACFLRRMKRKPTKNIDEESKNEYLAPIHTSSWPSRLSYFFTRKSDSSRPTSPTLVATAEGNLSTTQLHVNSSSDVLVPGPRRQRHHPGQASRTLSSLFLAPSDERRTGPSPSKRDSVLVQGMNRLSSPILSHFPLTGYHHSGSADTSQPQPPAILADRNNTGSPIPYYQTGHQSSLFVTNPSPPTPSPGGTPKSSNHSTPHQPRREFPARVPLPNHLAPPSAWAGHSNARARSRSRSASPGRADLRRANSHHSGSERTSRASFGNDGRSATGRRWSDPWDLA